MQLDTADQPVPEHEVDGRPPVWSGHIRVGARDVAASTRFYEDLGMRRVFGSEEMAVLELRGGTHLIVRSSEGEGVPVGFDLMVDDVEATHRSWQQAGLSVSELTHGRIHDAFTVTDPAGNTIVVNSTHVAGVV